MNDETATLSFYGTHRKVLVDYAYRITGSRALAEDVVQEAWIRLHEAEKRDRVHEPLRYIYRIVRNLSVDVLRRYAREGTNTGIDMDFATRTVADDAPTPERIAIDREDIRRVAAALDELPERQRVAVEMYRLGDYKLREIAEHLGVSVSLVHYLIAEAMAHCDRRRNEDSEI